MKIVLFGGTTEGRILSQRLADMGAEVTVSVVSEYGAKQQGEYSGTDVIYGPKGIRQMEEMLVGADLVIDATHPYALEVSSNIRNSSKKTGVPMMRIIREESLCREDGCGSEGGSDKDNILIVSDRKEAAEAALGKGNILLTTGVRDLPFYCEALDCSCIYARVLPSKESIEACMDSGIDPGHIIAMQGPFSQQMNEAVIREFDIKVLITKESGRSGGFMEKITAGRNCGITAVVIRRPQEEGLTCEEAVEECRRMMEKQK